MDLGQARGNNINNFYKVQSFATGSYSLEAPALAKASALEFGTNHSLEIRLETAFRT